jgi:hypothetical protein
VSLWKSYGQEQSNTADETRKLTRELYNAADAFDEIEQRRKKQQEQAARSRQLALGIAAPEQLDIERQRLAERLELLELTNFSGENAREIQRIKDQQARLEENVAAAAAFPEAPATAAAAASERATRRGGRGGGRGGVSRPTLEELMREAGGGGALTLEGLDMETLGREPEAVAAIQAKEDDVQQRRYLEQLDRNREFLEARERQEEEAAERLKSINDSVFQALESAFASSVSAWLDGSKSMGEAALGMVQDVARALTTEAIVQGLKQTALGISALAVGSPTAAGHFAAAAKWAAVGVAAGVAGAATGAFGGAGGGGGAPAAATGGPALTPGTAEGAGTTVVINWGSSGLVYAADRAQLGRDISGMISEAHGRLGRGM